MTVFEGFNVAIRAGMGRAFAGVALVGLAALGGCSPVTLGAHAIQPSQAVDTREAWIYLQTNDATTNGIYRCYDNATNPVCKKAKLERP